MGSGMGLDASGSEVVVNGYGSTTSSCCEDDGLGESPSGGGGPCVYVPHGHH